MNNINGIGRFIKKQVLIVDDDAANRSLLKNILEDNGWETTEAENGQEALDKILIQPPDLIITDILMPVMDGYLLCRKCKLNPDLKEIPFIFYSAAYTEQKDQKFALELGADRFILKPAETDVLIQNIQELLNEKSTRRSLAPPTVEEIVFFKRHDDLIFRKLENKMLELDETNQKLKALEEQYRLSFDNAMDVIFLIDINYNITSISPSVKKNLGYEIEDFIGRSVWDLIPVFMPDYAGLAKTTINMVFQGKTVPSTTFEFTSRDGQIIVGEISGAPIFQDGKVSGLVAVARDVTDRHLAEKKLLKSEKMFSDIFHLNPNPMAISDMATSIYLDVNEAFISWSGFSRGDLIGLPGSNLRLWVNPEECDILIGSLKKSSGDLKAREVLLRQKDGAIRNVLYSIRLIEIEQRECLLTLFHDITERKQAELSLRESEKRYKFIADKIPDIVWMLNMDLQTVYVSPSVKTVLGFTEEERMSQTVEEQLTPESLALVSEVMVDELSMEAEGSTNPDRNLTLVLEYYHKDGTTRFMETVVGGIRNESGVVTGLHGVNRDITERMQAEEKLKRTLTSLRRAVGTTIQVMVSAVEARDPYTAGHQMRSSDLARAIATEMGLAEECIEGIRMAAVIHDIGKLSVPSEILTKPTKLTNIEFSLIKEHAQKGYDILKNVESPWPLAQIVYQHHERMDGTGYPRRLKGDEILMEARVLAVADVVEAIASNRPYRPAFGIEPALEEIEKNRGVLYDATVVDACVRLFRQKGYFLALS